MKTSRIVILAAAAVAGIASLLGSAQPSHAFTTDFRWANNPGYVSCLRGVNQRAAAMGAKGPAYANDGRQACNRIFYGHN